MARPCQGEAGLLSPSRKGLNARPTKTSQIPGHCCCYGLGIHPTDTLVPCARLILKGKRDTKEKFGAVRIYNEAGPRLPSKTLFCPFYSSGKVKICVLDKGCWMVGSRLGGSLKAVGMDWTVGVSLPHTLPSTLQTLICISAPCDGQTLSPSCSCSGMDHASRQREWR